MEEHNIRPLFAHCFMPNILVLTTKDTEDACMKNNYSFTALLNSFSNIQKKVTYRLVNGSKTIKRDSILVHCLNPDMLTQSANTSRRVPIPSIPPCGDQNYTPDVLPIGDPKKLQNLVKSGKISTTWFDQHCWNYFRSVGSSEHEVFEHPVAIMMVTTSADPEPYRTFQSLFLTYKSSIPPYMDHTVLKVYTILHDCSGSFQVKVSTPDTYLTTITRDVFIGYWFEYCFGIIKHVRCGWNFSVHAERDCYA